MSLNAGTKLGPYEILSPLGAGGMGEVYRARDTRLGRDVAIKVLPQHLSQNAEVRARFEREAKTVSGLNHPNICTLFDVGREGETDYLVMELIEGETLGARLARGALPAPDVLKLGAQIADALDRAHRAGVVHRDLKPGNIMLTKSGTKLMDFGLARATGMSGPGGGSGITQAALTQSPTIAQPLTAEGTIVGTFQYMSPEQLEGKEADARSDIWSLGCVLYEMATGRRAFEGRSQASLISLIMTSEPPSVSQMAPMAPPGLDRLVRTCLTKDPDERARTAHDVKLQLLGLAESSSQTGLPTPPAAQRPRRGWMPWAIAAVCALVAAALAFMQFARKPVPAEPVQLSLSAPEGATFVTTPSSTAISPDGRAVAFCARDSTNSFGIWVRRLDSVDPVRLTSSPANSQVFWSPDGRTIGYLMFTGSEQKLMTIPASGGTPVSLADARGPRGATWSDQGVILYAPFVQGPIYRVSPGGGERVPATTLDSTRSEASHRFPCFLPDGVHFLFAVLPPGPDGFDIYVGSLESTDVQKVMTAGSAPVYAEPGYLLFRRQEKLMVQRFDTRALKVEGQPVALADVAPPGEMDGEPVVSVSRNGRLIVLDGRVPDTQIGWLDSAGRLHGTLALPAGQWGRPVLSPDNRFAVVERGDDLWRVDLSRSVAVRMTSNGARNSRPVWSPDGTQIAFTISTGGQESIHVMNSDGSGESRELTTTTELFKNPECWTRDGIVFLNFGATTFRDIWLLPVSSDASAAPLIQTRFSEYLSSVSPDGRWIAYLSSEAGFDDVYIQSFPSPGHKLRVSSTGASRVWWMPGSREVCYRTADGNEMVGVTLIQKGDDLETGTSRVLFRVPPGVLATDFTRDGQRVLISYASPGAQERTLRVVLNFTGLINP